MLVGFLYTCVSILVPFLIISIPKKGILLSPGNSIVNERLGWRLLRVERKSMGSPLGPLMANVFLCYLEEKLTYNDDDDGDAHAIQEVC